MDTFGALIIVLGAYLLLTSGDPTLLECIKHALTGIPLDKL